MTVREPAPHRLELRVYYEDTDFSGLVYHASYLRFMERGRTEWLRELGIDQKAVFRASPPLAFVVRRMRIDYLRPAQMDDVLEIETRVAELGGASLVLAQRILRGPETLIDAEVMVACVSGTRPARLPLRLRETLSRRGLL